LELTPEGDCVASLETDGEKEAADWGGGGQSRGTILAEFHFGITLCGISSSTMVLADTILA
jgi:hypothetical protein